MLEPEEEVIDANPWADVESATPISTAILPSNPAKQSIGMEGKNQLLLLVFVHGFKGNSDTTFQDFPSRLTHMLQETYRGLNVLSVIYPTYETRGSLAATVDAFVEWLTEQCVTLESKPLMDPTMGQLRTDTGRGSGMGSVKVILVGHSMGGLVAADAALNIAQSGQAPNPTDSTARLWPRICGVIAFDTPYYGVHPGVFKNGLNKYAGYLQTAQTLGAMFAPMGVGLAAAWNSKPTDSTNAADSSRSNLSPSMSSSSSSSSGSGWNKWFGSNRSNSTEKSPENPNTASTSNNWKTTLVATGAVALAGGAAASAMYFNKGSVGGAYGWVSDHLMFVSNLWNEQTLRQRLDNLIAQPQVFFHCFYTRLPAKSPNGIAALDRTFIILPPRNATSASSFTATDNTKASDEVEAHISMFNAKNNSMYFELGLRTAHLVALCLENEAQYGNQVKAQQQTRQKSKNGQVEEEKGLRLGDKEIEILKTENEKQLQAELEKRGKPSEA